MCMHDDLLPFGQSALRLEHLLSWLSHHMLKLSGDTKIVSCNEFTEWNHNICVSSTNTWEELCVKKHSKVCLALQQV